MNQEQLTLKWEGPISIGSLPTKDEQLQKMESSGVYVYTLKYPNYTVYYAGKAQNLLWRIQQHYGGYLGLMYYIRNEDGTCYFSASMYKRFATMNDVDNACQVAISEAKRLRFYYAYLRDHDTALLKPVESVLINRLKDAHQKDGPIRCDNARREGYGANSPPLLIHNSFIEGASELKEILGPRLQGPLS